MFIFELYRFSAYLQAISLIYTTLIEYYAKKRLSGAEPELEGIKIGKDDLVNEKKSSNLKKAFEENIRLEKELIKLENKIDQIKIRLQKESGDEFAYLGNEEYIEAWSQAEEIKKQIEQASSSISDFEINKLPNILGGTFDTIVANPNDSGMDAHHYYYNEFRKAFRKFMSEYVAEGKANDFELQGTFNELFVKLQKIDSSVKFVDFADFKRGIISSLNS